ncbi:deubiquitinating enzyme [Elasticomyces elasticus]|nr:deubiquitinating enzyme [Elasticomyces elasticus]KAK5000495.1 deubiquitinating enzyme [Elasticomyces elasticus]
MAAIPIIVKHQGKKYPVELDPTATGETFKYQLYSLTNVEPERQKILIKGSQLKDETNLATLGAKPNQIFIMMGTPSGDPSAAVVEKPKEKIRFLEDMTEAEAAQTAGATPAGLQNLGNTCYMNSTLQALRGIPELQEELMRYSESSDAASSSSGLTNLSQFGLGGLGASTDLTASLRDLYKQMGETQEGFPPLMFLNALRTAFPQFAQKAKDGHGYAQQDAEEAWSQIVAQLRNKLKIKDASKEDTKSLSWVDKFMSGRFETTMTCDEPSASEEPTVGSETFLKLDCNIRVDTNHLREGIKIALNESIEKNSPSLGRNAMYTKSLRISRLPKFLPVHFVRFFWRRDTNKKAKIMRKVTFDAELDAVEFCTETLKKQLIPIRDKIREVRKEEEDFERARKRQKRMKEENKENGDDQLGPIEKAKERERQRELKAKGPATETGLASEPAETSKKDADTAMTGTETFKTDDEVEAERNASILTSKKELLALVNPDLAADTGANQTGLYELRGVVTHQGSSADSGHYTAYVKKSGRKAPDGKIGEEDGKWWWFNDDRVSEVDAEKIMSLSGGGESHSALILLYRAIELPTVEELDVEEKGGQVRKM